MRIQTWSGNYRRVERLVRTGNPHTGIRLGKTRPSSPASPSIWQELHFCAGLTAACGEGGAGRCASAVLPHCPLGTSPATKISCYVRRSAPLYEAKQMRAECFLYIFSRPDIWGSKRMNNKIIAASCAIALSVAGISAAQAKGGPGLGLSTATGNFIGASSATPRPAGMAPTCISVAGMTGNGDWGSGDPNNTVIEINIGAGNEMTGAAADASITAFSPSWLSEATVTFSSTTASDPNAINLTMSGTDASGTEETSTGGVLLFADYSLPNIPVNADGILRLEFNEGFDDGSVNPDSQWNDAAAPTTCQGIYLTCTDQAACDAAVSGGGGTPLGETQELPTLSQWAMGLLALGLGMLAFRSRKRLFPMH
ncbi:MAG: IPTL-CTERM sorting domain-containing protein [Dokdonella sp.]|uniref:IPTL-CTERM sorting domain-containing protein n=1 Tax=Dokdonella sp. TaxID=2291710 RepID=UPI003BAF5476